MSFQKVNVYSNEKASIIALVAATLAYIYTYKTANKMKQSMFICIQCMLRIGNLAYLSDSCMFTMDVHLCDS